MRRLGYLVAYGCLFAGLWILGLGHILLAIGVVVVVALGNPSEVRRQREQMQRRG